MKTRLIFCSLGGILLGAGVTSMLNEAALLKNPPMEKIARYGRAQFRCGVQAAIAVQLKNESAQLDARKGTGDTSWFDDLPVDEWSNQAETHFKP